MLILAVLVNVPSFQNYMARQATVYLSKKLKTRVSIKSVRVHILNEAVLENVFIADRANDTLLFAGRAETKITDWFMFSDKPVISYIGLEKAQINLYRPATDSVWNYQFAIDAFKPGHPSKSNTAVDFNIDLRHIKLVDVHFSTIDRWVGSDMEMSAHNFFVDVSALNRSSKRILVNGILGDGVVIGLREYVGGRPDSLKPKSINYVDSTPFNPELWTIDIQKIGLKNSRFFMDDPDRSIRAPHEFDEWKMDIRDIAVDAEKIAIRGDTLRGNLKFLTAKERSGITIKKMQALVTVSPKMSECRNLLLETNNSIIRDYYAMHYERFPDFIDYISKVRMVGHLRNAKVAINDIIYFAPEMEIFKDMVVDVSGDCGGTVDNLYAKNTRINDGKSQLELRSFTMDQLPDVDRSLMVFEGAKLKTNGAALYGYFPFLKEEKSINVYALGAIATDFDLQGSIHNFTVRANLGTALGKVNTDLQLMQLLSPEPAYSGVLALQGFDLGTFIRQSDFGRTTGQFTFKGSSFDAKKQNLYADGSFQRLHWRGYDYQNLAINGTIRPTLFEGRLMANDPNVRGTFSGKFIYTGKNPSLDAFADIAYVNAKNLKFTDEPLVGSGRLMAKFSGNSFDNFIGTTFFEKLLVYRDSTKLKLDSIRLTAAYEAGDRVVTLTSNNLQALLWGDYEILDLGSSFQYLLSNYLPSFVNQPRAFKRNQIINFDIRSENINDLVSLFDQKIAVPLGGKIVGFVNTQNQTMQFDAQIPELWWEDLRLDSLVAFGRGDEKKLDLGVDMKEVATTTTSLFKQVNLRSNIFSDSLQFGLNTTALDEFGKAQLNGIGVARNRQFYINILPSEIFINNNKWSIPSDNEIVLEQDKINIKNLQLISGDQSVVINDRNAPLIDNVAKIKLQNLSLAPLTRYFQLNDVIAAGDVNGSIEIASPMKDQKVAFDLYSDNLTFYNDQLDQINLIGNYDVSKGILTFDRNSGIIADDGSATIGGTLSLSSKSNQNLEGAITFQNAHIAWLGPALKGFVNNLSGNVDGVVKIGGTADNPTTSGNLTLNNVELRPEINGETYKVNNTSVTVFNDRVDVGTMRIEDAEGNEGIITGNIYHDKLRKYRFNLRLNSERIRVLKLKEHEADRFYGNVFAKTSVRMFGPANDLNVNISATPLENSELVIPIDFGSDLGQYKFIKFKKSSLAEELYSRKKLKFSNKYNIRIDADINPNIKSRIVLDPQTNDQLISSGTGNIVMEIPSDGDIRLNGIYKIDEGTYNFAFRQMQILNYKRQFQITPGSTILWTGDLYDANLNVSATAPIKARLYDLVSNEITRVNLSQQEIRDAQIAQIVNVLLSMNGTLQKPEMRFKIELAENRSIGTYAYQKLERINADQKQLLNQVASLLLLEQFAPPEGFINTASVSSGTINNMSEVLSSVASSQLTNFASRLFNAEDLYVGVTYKNYNLSNSTDPTSLALLNRNEAKLNVRKNLFNDRLLLDVGGVYDWGRPIISGQRTYTDNLAGDFRAQYLITKDGRIRFNIFRNSSYDAIFQQNIGRQGIGISFRKSFNTLGEFFARSKEKGPMADTAKLPSAAQNIKQEELKKSDTTQ